MKGLKKKSCWEIMQCRTSADCAVRSMQEDTNCWEAARELNDYQAVLNICQECIVYLHSQDNTSFTKQEVEQILHTRKTHCNMG